MKIGGLVPVSLLDYPGMPCISIFTLGCNLRCPFCHNPGLVLDQAHGEVSHEAVLEFLRQRRGKVNAVCISGGEPTVQPGLVSFIREAKHMGYKVKLDTNGSRPEVLQALLDEGLLDYAAIDIKSSPAKYRQATGGLMDFALAAQTVDILRGKNTRFELRTTAVPGLVSLEDLEMIIQLLGPVPRFALQQFRSKQTLDPAFAAVAPYPASWFEKARNIIGDRAQEVTIRGICFVTGIAK